MKKYQYPTEITEENWSELTERSKEINSKAQLTFGFAIVISIVIFLIGVAVYSPSIRAIGNPQTIALVLLAVASGFSVFLSVFLIEWINLFLRRIRKTTL